MAYISEPGWFAEAISSGVDRFQSARDRRDRNRQIEIENKRQDEQFKLQQAQDARASKAADIANYLPSLKNQIVRNPDANIPRSAFDQVAGLGNQMGGFGPGVSGLKNANVPGTPYTDIQREAVGLPTALDLKKRQFEGTQVDQAIKNAPQDAQAARLKQLEPLITSAAERFIATPILKAGGRLNPKALPQLAQSAYTAFIKEQQSQGFGNLTPEESTQARAYFDKAVNDAYGMQMDRDTKKLSAMPSSYFGQRDTSPQMVNALTNLANKADGLADDMLKTGVLKWQINQDPATQTPEVRAQVEQYNAAKQAAKQLFGAASAFGAGSMGPDEAKRILEAATQQFIGTAPSKNPQGTGGSASADIRSMSFQDRKTKASEEYAKSDKSPASLAAIKQKWGIQ